MAGNKRSAKTGRSRTRRRAVPPRRAVTRRARPVKRVPGKRQGEEIDALRTRAQKLSRSLREVRRELSRVKDELGRLMTVEAECEALRRELGAQRPLLPLPPHETDGGPEPWMPAVVESHLTALHDHDLATVEVLLAPDVAVIEAAFPDASAGGKDEALALHAEIFARWTDFRFMPRHWHNLGGAAFLEGEASFIQRGDRHGIRAHGKLVTLDMLLIYHLSGDQIRRIKIYYDAGSLRRQTALPGVQGELF